MTVPWHFYSNTSHISIIIVYLITTWEQDHKTTQVMSGATMHHHWFRDGHLLFADWWLCCWHFSHCKSLPCMTSYSRLVLHRDLRSKIRKMLWKCRNYFFLPNHLRWNHESWLFYSDFLPICCTHLSGKWPFGPISSSSRTWWNNHNPCHLIIEQVN